MRRAASIRRRLRSSVTSGASRNMRSMTRQRRPETGPIDRAPSPSTRSKRFMSDRPRLPTTEGAAQALAMIEDAGGSTTISFDPNCRPNLVRHKARYVDQMNAFAAAADIVRMSDVDFEFLYGGSDYGERAKSLIAAGTSLVVVTRGINGAQAWHRGSGSGAGRGARNTMWWIRSGQATAFRRRCCSRCAQSDAIILLPIWPEEFD